MNEELFNEATKSNVLTKKLIDQLLESMTYSSISFINWTIETLSLIKARLQRGDRITDEVSGEVYTLYSFQQFVEKNFSTYIASQVFKETSKPEKIYFSLKPCEEGYSLVAADSDSNKLMTGELFEIDNDVLRVVSLDGHRISIRKIELKDAYQPRKVIVPGKTLQEISKIIGGEADAEVEISFTKNHIVFEFDRTLVVSRLIEGEYFRIDQMLSSDYETRVHVNKKELLDCIDRATLLIKEGDKKPIIIDIKNESMELKIKSQIGSMDELIFCTKDGKDLMIGFNPKFLIDALRVIEDEEVDLYFMNAKAPCFIKDENQSYIYLILPVNFNAAV